MVNYIIFLLGSLLLIIGIIISIIILVKEEEESEKEDWEEYDNYQEKLSMLGKAVDEFKPIQTTKKYTPNNWAAE